MFLLAAMNSLQTPVASASQRAILVAPPMDVLMVLGFLTSILTLLFWMHQRQSRKCVVATAICLTAMAAFALLQGAWPVGMIEFVFSCEAFRRGLLAKEIVGIKMRNPQRVVVAAPMRLRAETRISRMFGPS